MDDDGPPLRPEVDLKTITFCFRFPPQSMVNRQSALICGHVVMAVVTLLDQQHRLLIFHSLLFHQYHISVREH